LLTRRAFTVAFEWSRLARLVAVMGGLAAAGDLLLPTRGAVGLVARAVVWAAIPVVLLGTGFAHRAEVRQLRALLTRARRAYPPPAGNES
jgi:hypothetical protein